MNGQIHHFHYSKELEQDQGLHVDLLTEAFFHNENAFKYICAEKAGTDKSILQQVWKPLLLAHRAMDHVVRENKDGRG